MGCGASIPPVPAPAEAAPADELGVWLREHKLEQYEDTLRDSLGASSVADLRTMGESDWLELGLKKLEVTRALRELNSGEESGSLPGSPGPGVNQRTSASADVQGAADAGAPDKAKVVVQGVPPESRAEAAANGLVGRVEEAREAVEERVEQGQARVDEAALAYTAVADAEASLLGTEVRLNELAPHLSPPEPI